MTIVNDIHNTQSSSSNDSNNMKTLQTNQGSIIIHFQEMIGNGTFANVHLGHIIHAPDSLEIPDNNCLAIKCMNIDKFENEEIFEKDVNNEIRILQQCSHIPFVAKLFFTAQASRFKYLCLEFCSGGDMQQFMQNWGLNRQETIRFAYQVCLALGYLHQRYILYHDLKPENICIDINGNIKLVDFGLATIMDESTFNTQTGRREVLAQAGTLHYSAPEIFFRVPHSFEADWWSFGILIYEFLTGKHPYGIEKADTDQEKCHYICYIEDFERNEIIRAGSLEESFLSMFLQKDRSQRFGYSYDMNELYLKVLQHGFMHCHGKKQPLSV